MSCELHITSQGDCYLGGKLLHPAGSAKEQAARELQPLLHRAEPGDLLILAGAGLGWHALAAHELAPQMNTVVYEPDRERLGLLKDSGVLPAGIPLAASRAELAACLGGFVVYERAGWVTVFSPPAFGELCPELGREAKQELDQAILRGQVDRANLRAKKRLWLENLSNNFKYILEFPDLGLLGNAMAGVPAVIVGAGPSLDQSLPDLKEADRKALLMSAASALGPMGNVGIEPHLTLALEGKDESRQFEQSAFDKCLLAASSCSHPNHFSKWNGALGLFHSLPWLAGLLGFGPHIPSGGHVTSAAFSLACLWGCDPIILVGQDLAYSRGRMHAAGRPGGEDYEKPETFWVEAIGGGITETSVVMQGYTNWYREAAAYLQTRPNPPRLINASAQGARLPEFEEIPLGRVLDSLQEYPLDFERYFAGIKYLPKPKASYLAMRLARCAAETDRGLNALNKQGIEEFRKSVDPLSAIGFMLSDLPRSAKDQEAAYMISMLGRSLRGMAEGLHG